MYVQYSSAALLFIISTAWHEWAYYNLYQDLGKVNDRHTLQEWHKTNGWNIFMKNSTYIVQGSMIQHHIRHLIIRSRKAS